MRAISWRKRSSGIISLTAISAAFAPFAGKLGKAQPGRFLLRWMDHLHLYRLTHLLAELALTAFR